MWRPDDWPTTVPDSEREVFEAGAEAILEALVMYQTKRTGRDPELGLSPGGHAVQLRGIWAFIPT